MSDGSSQSPGTPEDREQEEGAGEGEEPRRDEDTREQDESERETEEDTRKPISVRDLMPSPSSRPARRPPERVERGERGKAEPEEAGPAEEEEEPGSPEEAGPEPVEEAVEEAPEPTGAASVPTPVRVAMDAPPPGDSRPAEELPSRRFEVEGREWIVRISGRTVTGTRPDAGALLMHLSFFRPDEPGTPVRRLVTVDRPLDAFYEPDLLELFERSRAIEAGSGGSD